MSTIDNQTITQSVTLVSSANYYPNFAAPLTITSTGAVEDSTGIAIYGPAGSPWTVVNQGTITASGEGVALFSGGHVDNAGGRIEGNNGVRITGAGTLTNSGTITGSAGAVVLLAGGTLHNDAGVIQGGNRYGVFIGGTGTGTVTNSGTILALNDIGVVFRVDGVINNAGWIEGFEGIYFKRNGGASVVSNAGTVIGTADSGVYLRLGGSVSNIAGLIQGSKGIKSEGGESAVVNAGTIIGAAGGAIELRQGGSVDNTGLIEGLGGISIIGDAGRVTNSGTILGIGYGVLLSAISNIIDNVGLIEGNSGIRIGSAGNVSNSGTIIGTSGLSVYLNAGGSVANTGTGLIRGYSGGIDIRGAAGTVTNFGTIIGANAQGVYLGMGGIVFDSGTISGTGTAVAFGGTGGNLLVLEHGYFLGGAVTAAGTANTLELLGAAGTIDVDFNKAGAGFPNFTTVLFGAPGGNVQTLTISDTASLPGTIASFTAYRDVIDLTQLNPAGVLPPVLIGQDLVVNNGSQTVTLHLDTEDYSGVVWQAMPDGNGGTNVSVACYCRGTLILTADGEVPVEELAIGDVLLTVSGEARPIRWIGRRGYYGLFIAGNKAVLPICLTAGALADGVPARNLWVSPEHSIYIDDVLVQAKHLVNSSSIVQADSIVDVEYFHIELESHDVIYADGALAETFVDCDNRMMFENGAEYARVYPEDERPQWQFCAPRLDWGSPELMAIRAALSDRAEALGLIGETDGDLHIILDGAIVLPEKLSASHYSFLIPPGSRDVRLASRSAVPAERDAWSSDVRQLGVPLERIVLSDADITIEVSHTHPGLCDGFHADEPSHRWTDGGGGIPEALLRPFTGGLRIEVQLAVAAEQMAA